MRKGENKLNRDGLPIDARDWTEADWQDLHEAIERIKQRIAERHRRANHVDREGD